MPVCLGILLHIMIIRLIIKDFSFHLFPVEISRPGYPGNMVQLRSWGEFPWQGCTPALIKADISKNIGSGVIFAGIPLKITFSEIGDVPENFKRQSLCLFQQKLKNQWWIFDCVMVLFIWLSVIVQVIILLNFYTLLYIVRDVIFSVFARDSIRTAISY